MRLPLFKLVSSRLLAAVLCLLALPVLGENKRLIYNSVEDSLGRYSFGLVKLALDRSQYQWDYKVVPGEISQARVIEMVADGQLDVMWAATNQEMEDRLEAIRIPLYKGLLGHRIFLIEASNQAKFNNIHSLDDLRKISMGQGTTWADTGILRHNGLIVVTANKYDSLFYMVAGGRFDAYPRGVQEPWSEMASRPQLPLAVEKNLMLVYKMPFYLFVSKDNKILSSELYKGLRSMVDDGSFHHYFVNDPTVQDVVNKSNIKNRMSFQLSNPTLPPETPINDASLWLDPRQL